MMLSSASTLAMLAAAKASVSIALQKMSRWPAGTPGSKGGQFAPGKQASLFGAGDSWGLSPSVKAPPPPSARPHLKVDDKGANVLVHYPTKPSGQETWADRSAVATAVPGGKMPSSLNGVALKTWTPPPDWKTVGGTNEALDAGKPLNATDKQRPGAGVVIIEPDGRMWLTKPTNEFGGYQHSWPKGGVETGLTLQQTAIKEAWEETGLKVKIRGVLGDYDGDTSKARYYVAERVGGTPADMGWESQAIRLVPPGKLKGFLNRSRDKEIADDILSLLKDEGIYKSTPAPLYIRRDLLNADQVIAWAKEQGFVTALPAGQMHVTIAYSKTPVDWQMMGEDAGNLDVQAVTPEVDKTRQVHRFGEAAVLLFHNHDLEARWRELCDLGCSWDHDGFRPHVTISWNASNIDLSKVRPYTGSLDFGPEIFEPIDDNWKSSIVEKADKKPAISGSHWQQQARWPAGSPLGGQFKPMDSGGVPVPPKIAGGLEGANASYQKQANALYSAFKAGDKATVKGAVDKLGEKVSANAAKGAKSSHVKWTAQLHQFGQSLLASDAKVEQAVAAADAIRGPMKLTDMQKTGTKPGGSAPGALYTDKGGTLWLVKGNVQAGSVSQKVSDDRAKNEVLASHLLNAVGAGAPEMKLANLGKEHGGGIGVASKWVGGVEKFNPGNKAHLSAAQQQFAVHAWLGNYDVIGASFDNTVIKDGKALCIDPGGSILFRAQGKPKDPGAFGDKVDELKTLRDPKVNKNAAAVYGSMTASQIAESCAQLKTVDNATIVKLVESYGPGDIKEKAALAATLIKRRDDVIAYGESLQAASEPAPAPAPKPPRPAAKQPKLPAADDLDDLDDDMIPELEVPTFKTGFAKTDKAYTMAAAYVQSMHDKAAAGNGVAMLWLNNAQSLVQQGQIDTGLGMHKIQPGSASAKKLHAFIGDAKASAQPQFIAADAAVAAAATVEAAKAKAAADAAMKAQQVALPNFDGAKLPAGNTNAGSHNAKVDAIKSLAASGDVNGLLALGFGTNTYGKQQAKLANDTLAALGSAEKVAPGQKKGTHPLLSGKAPSATIPLQPEAAPKKKRTLADLSADKLPPIPDVMNWNGAGKPYSSKAWKNQANIAALQALQSAVATGGIPAMDAVTFPELHPDTGQPTGKMITADQHPAKKLIGAYKIDLANAVNDFLNPPRPLAEFNVQDVSSAKEAAAKFVGAKFGTTVQNQAKDRQFGFWLALGKIRKPLVVQPENAHDITQTQKAEMAKDYGKYSAFTKTWIAHVQSSGQINRAIDEGKAEYAGLNLHDVTKALYKDASILPTGATLHRYMQIPKNMLKQIESAPDGLVFQSGGGMCTSISPTATSHFGPHRVQIIAAPGAKAIHSHGSGKFEGEQEITTLPGQRFVLLGKEKVNGKWTLKLLMLPPEENWP